MTSNQSLIRAWTKLDNLLKREEEDPDATNHFMEAHRRSVSPRTKTSTLIQPSQTLQLRPATAKNAQTIQLTRPTSGILRPATAKMRSSTNIRPLSGISSGNNLLTIETRSPTSFGAPMISNFLSPNSTVSRTNLKSAMSRSSALLAQQYSPKTKFFDDNSVIHSVTMPELTKLYEMKCVDNKIESSQNQLKYFLDKFDKSCKKRILDFEDQSIGIASALEIANIVINNEHFIKIHLAKNFISDQGAKYIAAALRENTMVIHLDVGSCNLGIDGAIALFEVLLENTTLISLKMNSYEGLFRNRFDHKACMVLTDVLAVNTSLQFLNLANCSIGTEGAMCIAKGIEKNNTLVSLDISQNEIGHECALHLSKAIAQSSLTELYISGNKFGDQGMIHLFHMFSTASVKLSVIEILDISRNGLTTIGLSKLCEILTKNQTLKKLYVDSNTFNGKAIGGIINLLWENSCLKLLSLRNCQMGIDAANAIATGFQRNKTIDTLLLSRNFLSDKGIAAIADSLKANGTLKRLDFSGCRGKDEGGKAIAELIRTSYSLAVVDLKDNGLFDPAGLAISEAIKANKNIKKVNLEKNPIAYKYLEEIRKGLEKNNNELNKKKVQNFGSLMTELKAFENEKYRVADERKENEYNLEELREEIKILNEEFEVVKQEEYEKYDIIDKEYQALWNENRSKDKQREGLDEIIRNLNQDIIIGGEVSESENRRYQDEFGQMEKDMRTIKEEHEAARVHYEKQLERLKKELKEEEKKVNVLENTVQMTENQVIKLKLNIKGLNTPRNGGEEAKSGGVSRQNSYRFDRKMLMRQGSSVNTPRDGDDTEKDKTGTNAQNQARSNFSKGLSKFPGDTPNSDNLQSTKKKTENKPRSDSKAKSDLKSPKSGDAKSSNTGDNKNTDSKQLEAPKQADTTNASASKGNITKSSDSKGAKSKSPEKAKTAGAGKSSKK